MADDPLQNTPEVSGNSSGVEIVLGIAVAFLCGLLIRTVSSMVPYGWRKLPLPFTAAMLIAGAICGAMASNGATVAYISKGLLEFEAISPSVLFAVFLPALIVPSGFGLVWHTVTQVLDKALGLALFGTMINATLIALVARFVFPYNWAWSESWLFGSILSATDPVAVVSIMQSFGSAPRLTTIVEGESLLNDGVAYVMFEIFFGWAAGEQVDAGSTVGFVFKASLGGPALGVIWAVALMIWLQILFNDATAEISVTLTAAYTLWVLCDDILGVSGVLALVFFATTMGSIGKYHVSRSSTKAFNFFWEWIDWVANTLIFFLSGLIIVSEISKNNNEISGQDWGYTFALYALLLVARIVSIVFLSPILFAGRYGIQAKDMIMLSWAGLRGAVGLTLALIVYNSPDINPQFRILVFFHVAMMAVLTLIIQGSTTGMLLSQLGYTDLTPTKKHIKYSSAQMIEKIGAIGITEAKKRSSLLGQADWRRVEDLTNLDVNRALRSKASTAFAAVGEERQRGWWKIFHHPKRFPSDNGISMSLDRADLAADFRERLLNAVKSNYEYAFSQEYLTPSEVVKLRNSVDNSLDNVHRPLTDWENLRLQNNTPKNSDSQNSMRRCYRRFMDILLRSEGPLLGLVNRNAAMAITFCCAHASARRHLKTFAELELGDIEEGDRLDKNSAVLHEDGSLQGQHPKYASGDIGNGHVQDDLKPYWEPEEASDIFLSLSPHQIRTEDLIDKTQQQSTRQFKKTISLLRHMATHELLLVDDIRKILHEVLQESRDEQKQAEIFLSSVPKDELLDVRSEFVAISLLKRQATMLHLLLQGGLLDSKEVEFALSIVESRMKRMHGHYHIN